MAAEGPSSISPPRQRRHMCDNCERPIAVCLCHVIPIPPLTTTNTQLMIIHHPHESNHKLNTARLLTKSLRHVTTHLSRKLLPSHVANQSPSLTTTIYLFPSSPGSPALSLLELKESIDLQGKNRNLLLIVFDATWKHAKEMVKASEGVLEGLGAIRVCLDVNEDLQGGSIYDDELVLRKEPYKGCVSTLEAVARCLKVVEDEGEEIERVLIGVLKEMVRLQAGFLKPVRPRPKLSKKGKQNELQ
ncbi:tRNA-uridine aminocarboxypropyltransferase 2 [Mangifera indica]|uniref:tRNA-uridine aminocarboxypropyltransferase 2 n=1 Tax=Mangifera indica TaxID=29780 RepID=UPI001CFBCC18|nr:tRNA-uridine aminocarboxypropyltransferase 2 [Mangifera indica]